MVKVDRTDPQPPGRLLRSIETRARARHIPLRATLELTKRCNLQCRHCYTSETGCPELGAEQIAGILDQLAAEGCLFLTITGGEALIRDDFWSIADRARRDGYAVSLYTNGTLIDAEAAHRLRDLCLARVEISILGARAETHDGITQTPGSFAAALGAVDLLVERGVAVQVKSTWMQRNIGEAVAVEELARQHGASFRSGFLLMPDEAGERDIEALRVQTGQVESMIRKWAAAHEGKLMPPADGRTIDEEELQRLIPCSAGQSSCFIGCRGILYPCVAIREPAGDLLEDTFGHIWHSSDVLQAIRAIRVSDLKECRACPLYRRCPRCAGIAQMETGSLLKRSPQACTVAKATEQVREEIAARARTQAAGKNSQSLDLEEEKVDDSPCVNESVTQSKRMS